MRERTAFATPIDDSEPGATDAGVSGAAFDGGEAAARLPGRGEPNTCGSDTNKDLADALDNIFNHPNVGPFIARRLIQRLVTSNPSPEYVARVAACSTTTDRAARQPRRRHQAILLDARRARPRPAPSGQGQGAAVATHAVLARVHGHATERAYNDRDADKEFGQGPLLSPSVFNFFSPFYAPPGEISDPAWSRRRCRSRQRYSTRW